MKETELSNKNMDDQNKLDWEVPRLFCLDKGKTEGGPSSGYAEGVTYNGTQAS